MHGVQAWLEAEGGEQGGEKAGAFGGSGGKWGFVTALQRDSGSRQPLCQQKLAWKYCISPRGRGFQTIPRRILFSPPFSPPTAASSPGPTLPMAPQPALRSRCPPVDVGSVVPPSHTATRGVSRAPHPAVLPERCKQTALSWRAAWRLRPSLAWDGAPLKRQKDGMHQPEAGCESCTATASMGGDAGSPPRSVPMQPGAPSPPGLGFLSPTPFPSMRKQPRSCVYRANNGAPASIYSWVPCGAAGPPREASQPPRPHGPAEATPLPEVPA